MGEKLGQHFLISLGTAKRMAQIADIKPSDTVLEIGPGKGILTEALLAHGNRVIAIEKDPELCAHLRQKFSQKDTLVLIEADIRDVLKKPKKYNINLSDMVVVANIPYYLSGQLFRLLVSDTKTPPRLIVLMVQKEVGERVMAGLKNGKTNLLALSIQPFMEPHIAFRVSRGQFQPPPAVDSVVLILKRRPCSLLKTNKIDPKHYFALIKTAFAHKRKLALSNLSNYGSSASIYGGRASIVHVFTKCSIPKNARAEDISLEKWLCIAKKMVR